MTATAGTTTSQSIARLPPGFKLGDFRLQAQLFPLRIADAYRAEGPGGVATVYVVRAAIAGHPGVRDQVIAGTRRAAAASEHRHIVRTLAAGLTGEILWIATEEIEGSLVRELLVNKQRISGSLRTPGLGVRATGNLVTGVTAALADVPHGALASESVVVSRTGHVRVIDLALGPGTLAAMVAGLIPTPGGLAPESAAGAPPTAAADVYAIGALLYEALVSQPLERGGPRPSDVVQGLNTQIDEIVARACHHDPAKRFGRAEVLGEVVAEALHKGGAMQTAAVPTLATAPTLGDQAQLVAEPLPGAAGSGAGSVLHPALAAALADATEKWLISKDRMDYGPFSLVEVIAQIERGEIVAGNHIQDKDTGARAGVAEHPLLGPIVEAARQRLDDARRAQAEVKAQHRDRKRGALLYALIGLGVASAAAVAYLIFTSVSRDDGGPKLAAVSALDGASLKVKLSEPKKPPAPPRRTARRTGGTAPAKGENPVFDMADDNDESETLDTHAIYNVYARYGARLGGCLAASGQHSANIEIAIDGPSGRVTQVRVNASQSGGLYSCLNGVMRGMQFPKVRGPRTRAEFDIAM